jgi:ribulose-phosphate 3-epimerase
LTKKLARADGTARRFCSLSLRDNVFPMKPLIAPSVLSADFANLQRDIGMLNRSQADWIHFDVMDGQFVPNISMGIPVCEAVHRHAQKPLDVHLMIVEPERYLEAFRKAGAGIISVHVEACIHLHRTLEQIKKLGCQAGVAINPHTPVSDLEEIVADADLVNVMSVNPGFGGQKLIPNTFDKVARLKELILRRRSSALIEIDGGVNQENAAALLAAGADVLVAGSFVFTAPDPEAVIASLKTAVRTREV